MSQWSAVLFILSCTFCLCSANDPCFVGNHMDLPYEYQRSVNCPSELNNFCDNYLSPGWYKVAMDNAMPTECVDMGKCGTTFPIWMNGTSPSACDGIVDRTACISYKGYKSCCEESIDIKVKNCSTFLVYNLITTASCPVMYCFGSSTTCEPPTTTEEPVSSTNDAPSTVPSTSAPSKGHKRCECPMSEGGFAAVVCVLLLLNVVVAVLAYKFGQRNKVNDSNLFTRSPTPVQMFEEKKLPMKY